MPVNFCVFVVDICIHISNISWLEDVFVLTLKECLYKSLIIKVDFEASSRLAPDVQSGGASYTLVRADRMDRRHCSREIIRKRFSMVKLFDWSEQRHPSVRTTNIVVLPLWRAVISDMELGCAYYQRRLNINIIIHTWLM